MLIRMNSIERAQGVIARVLQTSKTIKDWILKRPGGYKDYSQQEMEVIIGAPLLAEDYKCADKFMLLLMQPQVKVMLNLKPVGKTKAKNTQRGTSTLPKEFLDHPIPGPEETENLVSLSPFKEGGIYYTRGCFGKQLKCVLGSNKLPVLPPTWELARLLMIKSHCFAHMSASNTTARSGLDAWIVPARLLARKITNDCP